MRLPLLAPPQLTFACALAILALLAAAGCAPERTTTARGACPTTPLRVVVTVNPWSDLVARAGGDCVSVTTIIGGAVADPHDYEPSPADAAAIEHADLVVLNGAGYDHWAQQALDATDHPPAHVNVASVAGVRAGDDPHLWYQPSIVSRAVSALTRRLRALLPPATRYLASRSIATDAYLRTYSARVAALATSVAGRTYAATEPLFDRMAAALGLRDVTPREYRNASRNDAEPSPAAFLQLRDKVEAHAAEVLVVNPQTDGPGPRRVAEAARSRRVPVVEMTETQPPGASGFVAWQVHQLDALEAALRG